MIMKLRLLQFISVFINILSTIKCCPKPEILSPCICNENEDVICGGHEPIDLKNIFQRLSPESKNQTYNQFILNNTAIHELEENTFNGTIFTYIYIENTVNLTHIHSNAFKGTDHVIEQLTVNGAPIKNDRQNYDIFSAIRSMHELGEVNIVSTEIEEIPDNAFKMTRISGTEYYLFVTLRDNKIKKIGDNAFDFTSINLIDLRRNPISHITKNAFKVSNLKKFATTILFYDCSLNSTSFETGAFDNLYATSLSFSDHKNQFSKTNNTKITYLDQRVFESFLSNRLNANRISVDGIDCDDCRSFWATDSKFDNALLRTMIFCSNGKEFGSNGTFTNCKNYYR